MAREMPGYFFFFGGYEGTRYFLTPSGQSKEEAGELKFCVDIFINILLKFYNQLQINVNFIAVASCWICYFKQLANAKS